MRTALVGLQRMSELEIPFCRFCHRRATRRVRLFFALISRAGNGHFYYPILVALFFIDGPAAWTAVAHALAVAATAHLIYRKLKRGTARVRPFELDGFDPTVPALDKYSFPSGHTLHAVSFALVIVSHYAFLGWLLFPFAVLVALSRVILGLHYPTDVVAGAGLGGTLAWLSMLLV